MSFSIQTNVNSLVAQENLRVNSNFQSQTIQRLTSGYRINSSADDAAGLAVANKFRSDISELTQGVRNANDGVSQLQIMDGGMNNIGKMLDRLKTLATQSASDSFTGDRSVLNKEYQSLVGEIDRQAQAIGLSSGGHFAKTLDVFIGGGTTTAGALDTNNGTVALDLGNSVVDAKALGLRTADYAAGAATGTNLSSASTTSIANIVAANSGTATFKLSGEGYSGLSISISVTSSDTTSTLADKLNNAIQAAGNAGTTAANNLRTADLHANAVTDSAGNQQLSFTSASSAFQVTSSNATANALMGHFDADSTNAATGASVNQTVNSEAVGAGAAVNYASLKVTVNGTEHDLNVALASSDDTLAEYVSAIQASSGYAALSADGVTVQASSDGTKLQFVGDSNQSIQVQAAGDTTDTLGLGAWQQGTEVQAALAPTTATAQTANITLTINGTDVNIAATTVVGDNTAQKVLDKLTGDGTYADLQAMGVSAHLVGGKIAFEGDAGQTITVKTVADAADVLGFGVAAADPSNTTSTNFIRTGTAATLSAGSSGDTATVAFSINGGDKILVSFASDGTAAGTAANFQAAIDNNQELHAAGITVANDLSSITSSGSGVNFRMMVENQTGTLQLGIGTTSASSNATFSATDTAAMIASNGASQTGLGSTNDVFSFSGLKNAGATGGSADQQVLNFSAKDADGTSHSVSVTLNASNAGDVDSAVAEINHEIQASGDATLKKIVAVKETNAAGTAEGIRFISSNDNFSVGVGTSTNSTDTVPVGLFDGTAGATTKQGMTIDSSSSGAIDISTKAGAQQAVVALGAAVGRLGSAQAAVGKGQNQLNYAIGLAQSQISNFSSAQAQIRDADVASEAANLTKAQVLQQASIAAMAQANSAPQAVLALLRG
jgi:flagellin